MSTLTASSLKLNRLLIGTLGVVFVAWLFSAIEMLALSFGFSFLVAWMLSPGYLRLTKIGLPKDLAAGIIVFLFIVVIVTLFVLVGPFFFKHIQHLIRNLPTLYDQEIQPLIEPYAKKVWKGQDHPLDIAPESLMGYALQIITTVVASGAALANTFTLIILTPIVLYFTLSRWDVFTRTLTNLFPTRHQPLVTRLFSKMTSLLGTFIQGQSLLVLVLIILYTTGFSAVGIQSPITLGVFVGLLSFIPYAGLVFGFLGATAQLYSQGSMDLFGEVVLLFAIVSTIESFFLAPRLVGEKLGLNAAWCLFVLFAAGSLFGFLGLLLAYPLASILHLLIGEAFDQYRKSGFYKQR